jgi:hypothetical protein
MTMAYIPAVRNARIVRRGKWHWSYVLGDRVVVGPKYRSSDAARRSLDAEMAERGLRYETLTQEVES